MRIRLLQRPSRASVDGLSLEAFEPGQLYDVGTTLGMLFLAEGWAEPVVTKEPALLSPLRQAKPLAAAPAEPKPRNLNREKRLRYVDRLAVAADRKLRRRRRKPKARKI